MQVLKERKCPFNEETARQVFRQALSCLEYMHEKAGVANLDIKPGNMLFDSKFNLKLADFGCARKIKNSPTKVTIGTNKY